MLPGGRPEGGVVTHVELLRVAEQWLYGTQRCNVVLIEQPHAYLAEIPDAIGWTSDPRRLSTCHVVECKTSVSDTRADHRKRHAAYGESMGDYRWILAPSGVLTVDHLPPLHGLIEARKGRVYVVKHAPPRDKTYARLECEVSYLRVHLCERAERKAALRGEEEA